MHAQGTTLKLDFGTFYHFGIADGVGGVIHNSKKRMMVTHESETDFSEGKEVIVSGIKNDNSLNAFEKAKKYIGLPYNIMNSNCEHFVRLCHGLVIESTQIQKYLLVSVMSGVAYKNNNLMIKAASSAACIAALISPREESPFKGAAIAALFAAGVVFVFS